MPAPLSSFADRVLRTRFHPLDPAGPPGYGLPARPATLYHRRGTSESEEIVRDAGEPTDRYLRRAFAAGNPLAGVRRLADIWAEWGPARVRATIGRFDEPQPGAVPGPGPDPSGHLVQCDGTTCGPTVVVAARMIADPAYAHRIATAPAAAFTAAQHRVHRAGNVFWPRAFGMTPPGVARILNVHSGAFGARYGWRPVDPQRPHRVLAALDVAAASVDAGWPVPVLVGRWEPRHWVLVIGTGSNAGTLLCYEPTAGRIVAVTASDLAGGQADGLGYRTVHAIAYPTRLT